MILPWPKNLSSQPSTNERSVENRLLPNSISPKISLANLCNPPVSKICSGPSPCFPNSNSSTEMPFRNLNHYLSRNLDLHAARERNGALNRAPASWSAAVLCRFFTSRPTSLHFPLESSPPAIQISINPLIHRS